MKKLLIFPLSFILCLNLMVPIKAQSSYHLLFSSNTEYGPIVPQIQKAGRYYFSHDKKIICFAVLTKNIFRFSKGTVL